MLKEFSALVSSLASRVFSGEKTPSPRREEDLFSLVDQARREWEDAKSRFNQIADPDLVDYAIYDMEAAERRYVYLLKKAREEGFHLERLN
ncbi:MAG TPA: YaaL family protein [Bacillota bacterium]|jgi:hypothetical protein|nr:YaaL family protein [Bacillota bacterium]HOB87055.1 YaaL family protein [Bacillota bacterium]HOP69629.1 YaaL family protein [Bacillota bacterium]HPT33161.1 YaaL family protein [Bacillota bacterium]HQD05580.1 YaaL family protein [Bacillota bacterium]